MVSVFSQELPFKSSQTDLFWFELAGPELNYLLTREQLIAFKASQASIDDLQYMDVDRKSPWQSVLLSYKFTETRFAKEVDTIFWFNNLKQICSPVLFSWCRPKLGLRTNKITIFVSQIN